MALTQKYGIKYPFSNEKLENIYMDLNDTYADSIKSQVLHVIFTPKGQMLRDPEFGTDLIKYIYAPEDSETINNVKAEITSKINKYVPAVTFEDVNVYKNDENDNEIIVTVKYSVKIGNKSEQTTVAVKL
jgi:hypothetical protein